MKKISLMIVLFLGMSCAFACIQPKPGTADLTAVSLEKCDVTSVQSYVSVQGASINNAIRASTAADSECVGGVWQFVPGVMCWINVNRDS